ncbi:succinyl-diaminopimelate desuccinylase [Legionella israelensis]|uniref:Succinyl-diaminopimelate desuccinylase n=1 Tax=Legionella israelensis TaxID=454 RepID=A0AAX1EFU4_9GAMM|nr:succinyl-diaminopimelate desuccinylase [Legionella israelensis]QBR83897.1 succinyl-diaminopimelate desuccinylase [Legionella israelensis]
MDNLQSILTKLVSFPSLTPEDAGCQNYMIDYLKKLGFECIQLNNQPVSNFFARIGQDSPLLVFAGHTDVVPVGDPRQWHSDPFILHHKAGILYGRGVADMKGSLACMMMMAKQFVREHSSFNGSLGFLITSGEEGDHFHLGTPYVMEQLKQLNIHPDFCIVGEPSSSQSIADVIKIGRRGSLTAKILIQGIQGHVAYPHLAENPIHSVSPALSELTSTEWDQGNAFFPPTSMQITFINAGGHAGNIIPGTLEMRLNFRFSTEQTEALLKQRVVDCFTKYGLDPFIEWRLNGNPFLTSHGRLLEKTRRAVMMHTEQDPELSTSGGTSDGRFIAPYGVEVIELGPLNTTIHQVNESVSLNELEILTKIYYSICKQLLI